MNRTRRMGMWPIVAIAAGGLLLPGAAGAVTLDEGTFDACATIAGLRDAKVSRNQARSAAKELASLDHRRARKRLAPALREASSAKERGRAVAAAYRWCDRAADAYRETALELTSPPVVDLVDADSVTITGTTSPGATVTARFTTPTGVLEATTVADSSGAFSATVAGVPLGESTGSVSATAPLHYLSNTLSVHVRRTESEAAYKASTREVPSDELRKDPAGLRGTRIYSRGEVFQYDSRTGLTAMLVNVSVVNPGRFEFWTDPVLVRLDDPALGNGIDEDDLVEFWGEVVGAYSYETAIGGTNTVPEIAARYVNLLEKR